MRTIKLSLKINLLSSSRWLDYELLDSGGGQKLECFGAYTFVRPEIQALWKRCLPASHWTGAHAVFMPTGEESGGHWSPKNNVAEKWEMSYPLDLSSGLSSDSGKILKLIVMTTPGRHLGVFPECATHWDWIAGKVSSRRQKTKREIQVLNLFGYTGLATLAVASAGAKVTHVDASKKSVAWARENQVLSGLGEKPIRWIVDDALKFVQREARRGVKYDGIVLDPPKFGRGPKGEVWDVYKSLPELLQACRAVMSDQPLFVVLTVYAVKLPAIHAGTVLEEAMNAFGGTVECGELVTQEKSAGRLLSQAVYARWENME